MEWLQQEGIFQALPMEGGVRTSNATQSIAAEIKFRITDGYNPETEQFESWLAHDVWITGRFYVIGKDGNSNEFSCKALRDSFGWDGTLESLQTMQAYRDRTVQLTVQAEEYEGKTRYKIAFLNNKDRPADDSVGNCDTEAVRSLDAQYGPAFRALLGAAEAPPTQADPGEVDWSSSGDDPRGGVPDPSSVSVDAMVAAFAAVSVTVEMIDLYMGKPIRFLGETDLAELRKIYEAIQSGEDAGKIFGVQAPTGDRIPF